MRAALLLGLMFATHAAAARRETPLATAVGKPQDCVQLISIRETRVRDDRTIDFYMRDGRVLRNSLPYACPRLGFEETFSYATSLSRLCSVDIITVIPRGGQIRGASCGLGAFQPVTLAKTR